MKARDIRSNAWNRLRGNYWMLLLGSIVVAIVLGASTGLVLLIIGPATVGLNLYYMKVNIGKEPRFEDIIEPFKDQFFETLIAGLLKYVFVFLWSLLFIIPGIIKSYAYFLTEYIMVVDKDIKGQDAITKSQELMNGHKARLFYLRLSFIGWRFLGIITFGIGMIFLIPYIKMAEVEFALDLLKQHNIISNVEYQDEVIIDM